MEHSHAEQLVWKVADPTGRTVVLGEDRWRRILVKRGGALEGCEDALRRTVAEPDRSAYLMEFVTIGEWTFDNHLYDEEADVLYLSIGEPRPAYGDMTPEGHVLMFDLATDEFCGVTLVSVGELLELEGSDLVLTLPRAERLAAADLKPALAAA